MVNLVQTKEDLFEKLGKKLVGLMKPSNPNLAIMWLKYIDDFTLHYSVITKNGKEFKRQCEIKNIEYLSLSSDEAFDIKYQDVVIYFSTSTEIKNEIAQIIKSYRANNRSIADSLKHKYSLEEHSNRDWNKRLENILIKCNTLKEEKIISAYHFNKKDISPEIIVFEGKKKLTFVFGVNYAYVILPNNKIIELFELISSKDSIKTAMEKMKKSQNIPNWVIPLTACYDLRRK